jgi:heme-degrading monooxygenase HmoA
MLTRIVRMSFKPELVSTFERLFDERKELIAGFDGCINLKLMQDLKKKNTFFTISLWEKEADLEAYRNSALFIDTWAKTKVLFNEKPSAWSLDTNWDSASLDKLV